MSVVILGNCSGQMLSIWLLSDHLLVVHHLIAVPAGTSVLLSRCGRERERFGPEVNLYCFSPKETHTLFLQLIHQTSPNYRENMEVIFSYMSEGKRAGYAIK